MDLTIFRIGWTVFFLVGIIVAYFTIIRLMRVEYDGNFLYVTNYFKVYKYPIESVDKITIKNYSIFKLATIKFINKGSFGKKVVFLTSRTHFDDIMNAFSNLKEKTK